MSSSFSEDAVGLRERFEEPPSPGAAMAGALEGLLKLLEPLGLEDADALLEAARIELGLRMGPTTHGSAQLILDAWRQAQRR